MQFVGQGTYARYQGIPCSEVRFKRSRGIGADRSTVKIPLAVWDSLTWGAPSSQTLDAPPPIETPTDIPNALTGPPARLVLPNELRYEGTLVLSEHSSHVVSIPGLVIFSVETVELSEDGSSFVRLTLLDVRAFGNRGVLSRWRFNAMRPDGAPDKDTLKPDGKQYTLSEILDALAADAWRKPSVAVRPGAWANDQREAVFEPFGLASVAMRQLANLGGAEAPCLLLDNSLAFHEPGEGFLGYAPGGAGPNTEPLPPSHFADENGTGRKLTAEKGWPAEYLLFVGKERIASVAIDGWEPVLMINGSAQYLSEALVRQLTEGKHGLDWLQKFVLLSSAQQGSIAGVDDRVLKILREQAYRYWRLPGAEKRGGAAEGGVSGLARQSATGLLGAIGIATQDAVNAASSEGSDGFYTGEPGRNAHLLPLLDRAETAAGGRRLPPRVEAFGFEVKHRKFDASSSSAALINVRQRQRQVQQAATALAIREGLSNPFGFSNPPLVDPDVIGSDLGRGRVNPLTLGDMAGGLLPPGVERERVEHYLREFRRAQLLQDLSPELASSFRDSLRDEARAVGDRNGIGEAETEALELARELAGFEQDALNDASTFGDSAEENRESLRERFRAQFGPIVDGNIAEAGRKMQEARKRTQALREAGVGPAKLMGPTFLQNKRRSVDAGARVVSRELGVIRTSGLAGLVREQGVHVAAMTSLRPAPVRVTFGAMVRPRVDVPPAAPGGRVPTETGVPSQSALPQASNDLQLADQVPGALSERESYYTSAWRRTARGVVEQVDLESLPTHRAVRVPVRWRELVALEGLSNKPSLDKQARKAAQELSRAADEVRSQSVSVVGPWPVQCDGLISQVEIVSGTQDGAICGFTTLVTVGGSNTEPVPGKTRERGA